MKSFILLSFLFASLNAQASGWDGYDNPLNMDFDNNYQYNLNQLPMSASLAVKPWSETYWPENKGSINIRWNTPDQDGFYYTPYSKDDLSNLTLDQMKTLSPAEKYDVFMGHYDYPLWNLVRSFSNSRAPEWHGICDGWSIAAIQYPEPQPVTLPNPDGILVPFGSSDVKGLMAFVAATEFKVETGQVGVKGGSINPGAMHVILANQIAVKKQGFVLDKGPKNEIWNQPTYGYDFQAIGSADSDADHGIQMHGAVYFTDELDNSNWNPVVNTPNFKFDKIDVDYVLDLDANNNIVGGSWMRGSGSPHFFWVPKNHLTFEGDYAGINKIYKH